jgi:hypothetical protein
VHFSPAGGAPGTRFAFVMDNDEAFQPNFTSLHFTSLHFFLDAFNRCSYTITVNKIRLKGGDFVGELSAGVE